MILFTCNLFFGRALRARLYGLLHAAFHPSRSLPHGCIFFQSSIKCSLSETLLRQVLIERNAVESCSLSETQWNRNGTLRQAQCPFDKLSVHSTSSVPIRQAPLRQAQCKSMKVESCSLSETQRNRAH